MGGTINEDDHTFGLSAARKFGGIYVPANMAVIHQYAREELTGVGRMILGSDSHTRYGALGAMGIGEGGPELVKQLLGSTWEAKDPEVILVWLTGTPRRGVGPHDVAIALCGADHVQATIITKFGTAPLALHLPDLTAQERELILAGSLMNWYAANNTNEGE